MSEFWFYIISVLDQFFILHVFFLSSFQGPSGAQGAPGFSGAKGSMVSTRNTTQDLKKMHFLNAVGIVDHLFCASYCPLFWVDCLLVSVYCPSRIFF